MIQTEVRKMNDTNLYRVPNVSQVPKPSPFRYPGGKARWYFIAKRWIESQPRKPRILVESFAGGASVGLDAAIERWVDTVVLIDSNDDIAIFWHTVLSDDCDKLVGKIGLFDPTVDTVTELLASQPADNIGRAFQVFVRNRISRGGITADGAGILKNGENGKGLRSRWYPETSIANIRRIHNLRHKIKFVKGDALGWMKVYSSYTDAVFFIDPPYTLAGSRLYNNHSIGHNELFDVMSDLKGDFLATYDYVPSILQLAEHRGFAAEKIIVSSTHHRDTYEVLIARNLNWMHNLKSTLLGDLA